MPQQKLDDLRALALVEELCRECVTQGVEREAPSFEAGALEQQLVVAVVEVVVPWTAPSVREAEIGFASLRDREPRFVLTRPMSP